MKSLGSNKNKITKDKNRENVSHYKITNVILVSCNIVNKNYQQDLRDFFTFVPNKLLGQLLDMSPKNFTFKNI